MKTRLLTILFVLTLLVQNLSQAQTIQPRTGLIITWQANAFFPSDYTGKSWATPNALIVLSAEVVKENKILNLANATFYWYLDSQLLQTGQGLKKTSFKVSKLEGDNHFISLTVKPEEGGVIETSLQIPVFAPQLVIENNLRQTSLLANSQILFSVTPYFFNIASLNDLDFSWQINSQKQTVKNNQLLVNTGQPQTPEQKNLYLEVLAQNKKNLFEFVSQKMKLLIY